MARSLYDTLGLTKTATQGEIKKAYHAMCLRLHPDKNPGDQVSSAAAAGASCAHRRAALQSAVEKFQALQRVYSVLGDPEKRYVGARLAHVLGH